MPSNRYLLLRTYKSKVLLFMAFSNLTITTISHLRATKTPKKEKSNKFSWRLASERALSAIKCHHLILSRVEVQLDKIRSLLVLWRGHQPLVDHGNQLKALPYRSLHRERIWKTLAWPEKNHSTCNSSRHLDSSRKDRLGRFRRVVPSVAKTMANSTKDSSAVHMFKGELKN